MNRRALHVALLMGTAVLLAAGLYRLFVLRFASGDIFPPASSRRADPLGSRALHDALARHPRLHVSRNLLPLDRLRPAPGLAVLALGVPPENLGFPGDSPDFNTNLLRLAHGGARVVLGVQHESLALATNAIRQGIRSLANAIQNPSPSQSLATTLGFAITSAATLTNPAPANAAPTNLAVATAGPLPSPIPWPSPWRITLSPTPWTSLYHADDQPVVVERPWGAGSVVLLASDYLLSNEALRRTPQPAFIAALLGPSTHVLFDETHLGLTFEPGMASLIRRYQLGGAALGLALLVALYLWRNFAPFNPPLDPAPAPDVIPGRGSSDAFLALLRRALQPETVVAVCMEHWRAAHGRHPRIPARRVADAQDVLDIEMERPPKDRNPVATYRRIAALLHERKPR